MMTFTPFYILSGALAGVFDDESNQNRTDSLERRLHAEGLATVQVNGCYNGKRERSILVVDDAPYNDLCELAVLKLAKWYDQESVLAVDANRQARLIFFDHSDDQASFESIGQWRAVNKSEVMDKPGASYTERAGQYYTVK